MQHILILTGATSGAGTAYPSGAPEFTPVFSGVRVTRSLVYKRKKHVHISSHHGFSILPQELHIFIKKRFKIPKGGNQNPYIEEEQITQWSKEKVQKDQQLLTGATSGAGTAYPSGAPEFTPVFSGVRVTRSLVLYICFVDRCWSFCTFPPPHCVVCSLYGF
jgi:hypothetical protein